MGDIAQAEAKIAAARAESSEELNLSRLALNTEELKELIPQIKAIPTLKELNVSSNELTDLPPEIGTLTELTRLNVLSNKLVSLPPEIGTLTKLNYLNVSHNKLTGLPPEIGTLTELDFLCVSNNKLTGLTAEICTLTKLATLNVSDNKLVSLPPEISTLTELTYLMASGNQLTSLPSGMEHLRRLQYLHCDDNPLTTLPEVLSGLPQLRLLLLSRNPLSDDTSNWLDRDFGQGVVHFVSEDRVNISHERVLEAVYKDKQELMDLSARLEACDLGPVTIIRSDIAEQTVATEALKEFLIKVPVTNKYERDMYGQTAKGLLERVLDKTVPSEDRQTTLAKMAVSLGDCATPVKTFLMQEWVGQRLDQGDSLSERDGLIIEREAVIVATAKLPALKGKEEVEQLHGLVDMVYKPEAGNNPFHQRLRIAGDRHRLDSLSAYPDFAARQVEEKPALILQFALLVCKTDPDGVLIQEARDVYQLDPEKIKVLKERYIADRGLTTGADRPEMEKYIQEYVANIKSFTQEPGIQHLSNEHYDKPDVAEMLDMPSQEKKLRSLLANNKDGKTMEQVYTNHLNETKWAIADLARRFPPDNLAQFTTTINQRKRSQSEGPATSGPGRGTDRASDRSRARSISPRR